MNNINKTKVQSTWCFSMFKRFTHLFLDSQMWSAPMFFFELLGGTWSSLGAFGVLAGFWRASQNPAFSHNINTTYLKKGVQKGVLEKHVLGMDFWRENVEISFMRVMQHFKIWAPWRGGGSMGYLPFRRPPRFGLCVRSFGLWVYGFGLWICSVVLCVFGVYRFVQIASDRSKYLQIAPDNSK